MKNFSMHHLSSGVLLLIALLTGNSLFAHFGSKGPFGGSVSTSTVYDSTVYLGTFEGGVYESTTSKLTAWRARPVGLGSGKITALTHSGSYLFAGTADAGIYIFNGYVGTDRYWNKINTGLNTLEIKSLLALDSITVLAGTNGGGLYKTTNKGGLWTAVNAPSLNTAVITAMAKMGSKVVLTTLNGGVFVSADNGNTWTSFNDGNTQNMPGTVSLSYNATTDQLAVVNHMGVYVLSGAATATTPAYAAATTGLPMMAALRTITNNGTHWFLATDQGVLATATGTVSWATANTDLGTLDVTVVQPFKTDLVAGTRKEGIYKSAAATIAWVARNTNFNNLETYAFEASGEKVIAVATEKGVFVSRDLAATYVRANQGLTDSLHVTSLRFLGANLYAGTQSAGVFVSADTGKTWSALNTGLSNLNITKLFASGTDLYLVNAGNGLFQYAGSGWTSAQTGLPANVVPSSLAFSGTKAILGTLGQGVFAGENGIWTAANTGLTNLNVTSVTTNGTKWFAGTDGSGVFVADLTAGTWTQASPVTISHTVLMGLDGTKIQDMSYNAGYIFASYKGGLLATSDNGATWIAGGNQFNLPSYTNVRKISFVTTRVFVSTVHNSVYSNALSELPAITSAEAVRNTPVVSISPNPSNGTFFLRTGNSQTRIEAVEVFDCTGKQVQIQVSGSDLLQVQAEVPAGVYVVKLLTNEGIAFRKVVIE